MYHYEKYIAHPWYHCCWRCLFLMTSSSNSLWTSIGRLCWLMLIHLHHLSSTVGLKISLKSLLHAKKPLLSVPVAYFKSCRETLFLKVNQFVVTTEHWTWSENLTVGFWNLSGINKYQSFQTTLQTHNSITYYRDYFCSRFPSSRAPFRHDNGSSCRRLQW